MVILIRPSCSIMFGMAVDFTQTSVPVASTVLLYIFCSIEPSHQNMMRTRPTTFCRPPGRP
ncbi:hypothetical protein BJX63DRAFT_375889 [Aspergillus granulosus]|uniref:Uncharacterized protein n=1 Tax=Aspergillus granulosus TaxID=176169 RepID=A0ABR4I5G3_9EURO